MHKHIWFYALIASWIPLAVLSLLDFAQIKNGSCYFQTSWLFCQPQLAVMSKLFIFFLITLVTGIFIWGGWSLWRLLDSKEQLPRFALMATLCAIVLAFFVVPFGSSDTSYYFHAGKAVADGLNPYVQEWPMEKAFVYPVPHNIISSFSYGPIMLKYFYGLYSLSYGQLPVFLILWRVTMLASLFLAGFLVYRTLRQLGATIHPKVFFVFWCLQPLFLFEIIVNGHFDIIWLWTVLAALLGAMKRQWWLVIIFLVLGIWIKFIPLLFAPFFAIWWWQDTTKQNWQRNVAQAIIGCLLAGAITVLAWQGFWQGPAVFASVVIQSKWAVISWFAVIYYSLKPLFVFLFGTQAHFILTRVVHTGLLVTLLVFLFPYIKRIMRVILKKEFWSPVEYVEAMFVCLLAYLFIWQKSMWPWYMIWLIPIGLIVYLGSGNTRPKQIVRWMSTAPFVFYSLWLANWWLRGADGGSELWFYYLMVLTVTGYPLWLLWQWRRRAFKLDTHIST